MKSDGDKAGFDVCNGENLLPARAISLARLNELSKLVGGDIEARDPAEGVWYDARVELLESVADIAADPVETDGRWWLGSHFCLLRLHAEQAPSFRILAACSRCSFVFGPLDWFSVISTPSLVMIEKPGSLLLAVEGGLASSRTRFAGLDEPEDGDDLDDGWRKLHEDANDVLEFGEDLVIA
jgi:hypothetical protein